MNEGGLIFIWMLVIGLYPLCLYAKLTKYRDESWIWQMLIRIESAYHFDFLLRSYFYSFLPLQLAAFLNIKEANYSNIF